MTDRLSERRAFAERLAGEAGALGLDYQRRLAGLEIESKGPQDFVTEADRAVERLIRDSIAASWPEDAVIGEEYGGSGEDADFVWVIDPIDGTANFIVGSPIWCVSIGGYAGGGAVVGAINAPALGESYSAAAGAGATLNGAPITVCNATDFTTGTVGVGFPGGGHARRNAHIVLDFCHHLIDRGGVPVRHGSGALLLTDIACGRLIGGFEPKMNAWDCLAGMIIITEAGGVMETPDPATFLADGAVIIAAGPDLFADLRQMALAALAGGGSTWSGPVAPLAATTAEL